MTLRGPPGIGKTSTIAALTLGAAWLGKGPVLLTAETNAATEALDGRLARTAANAQM